MSLTFRDNLSLLPIILKHFAPKANVMLEYDIDEAQALLEKNLSTATRNLETLENDLDFLRDQFTTTEVSILAFFVVHSRTALVSITVTSFEFFRIFFIKKRSCNFCSFHFSILCHFTGRNQANGLLL